MNIEQFLEKYQISGNKNEPLNFYQIAGFPHYEIVFSNTISYFIENENKVFALLNNDTDNYYKNLFELAKNEKKELICIVLSKNKISNIPNNFISLLHIDLANAIKKNYGKLSKNKNNRHYILLQEFINNIIFLQKGTNMNEQFLKLLQN
jgi:hypothetical protein